MRRPPGEEAEAGDGFLVVVVGCQGSQGGVVFVEARGLVSNAVPSAQGRTKPNITSHYGKVLSGEHYSHLYL